jgi:hypothetical protein
MDGLPAAADHGDGSLLLNSPPAAAVSTGLRTEPDNVVRDTRNVPCPDARGDIISMGGSSQSAPLGLEEVSSPDCKNEELYPGDLRINFLRKTHQCGNYSIAGWPGRQLGPQIVSYGLCRGLALSHLVVASDKL